mgnify:CR=1 FL=1
MDLIASLDARYLDKIDRALAQATIVLIGNFDGFHLGHQSLLSQCLTLRAKGLGKVCVLTFSPNPSQYFGRSSAKEQLFTPAQKIQAFSEAGADYYLEQKFDREFSLLSAEDFYRVWLKIALNAKVVVVGYNFHFGFKRQGSAQWLFEHGQRDGIEVYIVKPKNLMLSPISSSRIRSLLALPEHFQEVQQMLGRPYLLKAYLTASDYLLDIEQKLVGHGFYAVAISAEDGSILDQPEQFYLGVLSVTSEVRLKLFSPLHKSLLVERKIGIYVHAFLGAKDEAWSFASIEEACHWKSYD